MKKEKTFEEDERIQEWLYKGNICYSPEHQGQHRHQNCKNETKKRKTSFTHTAQGKHYKRKLYKRFPNKSQKEEEHMFSSPENQNHHSHHNYKNQLHNLLKTKKRLPRARRKTLTYRIYVCVCVCVYNNLLFLVLKKRRRAREDVCIRCCCCAFLSRSLPSAAHSKEQQQFSRNLHYTPHHCNNKSERAAWWCRTIRVHANERKEGRKDGRKERRMDGRKDEWMNGSFCLLFSLLNLHF